MSFQRSDCEFICDGNLLISQLSTVAPNSIALANPTAPKGSTKSSDWSMAMVESTMKRFPSAQDLGSWGYAKSLYLYGQYLVWRGTGDKRYLQLH